MDIYSGVLRIVTLTEKKELEHCQTGAANGPIRLRSRSRSSQGTLQPVFRIQFICKLIDQVLTAEDMQGHGRCTLYSAN